MMGCMAKEARPLNTAQRNLRAIIKRSGLSVNAWSILHKVDQSTVNRIVTGEQDMTSAKMQELAKKGKFNAWHLLIEDFDATNPPVLRTVTDAEKKLYEGIEKATLQLQKLSEMNTRPGDFE